jgi:NADH-quinone oxidoreductase subunit M
MLLKSTYSFPYLASKCVPKAPAVGTMLLSGIMLKMGLYSIIRWQLPIAPLAAKEYMYIFHQFRIAGVIYGSILALRQKRLKEVTRLFSLAHVGLIVQGLIPSLLMDYVVLYCK